MYPLHSRVSLEEQNNVFLNPVPGYRKVNILESFVVVVKPVKLFSVKNIISSK